MILKRLVTGMTAAAAVVAAAGGVTSLAYGEPAAAPAVTPVVWDVPLPQAPAPELQPQLVATLAGLSGPGSYRGAKGSYIEGGLGRLEAVGADQKYNQKAAQGYFPLSFDVTDIDLNGPAATANVTATSATGATASMPLTFVTGPSPSGWQLSKSSVLALLSALS